MKKMSLLLLLFSIITFTHGSIKEPGLMIAAETFSITPKKGTPTGHSRTGNTILEVYGDLKTTVLLFKEKDNILCLVTSPLGIERGPLRSAMVAMISDKLNIPSHNIVTSSSHNHTIPYLNVNEKAPEKSSPQFLAWELGNEFMNLLSSVLANLEDKLEPVDVEWGKAEETRITYNRRGRYSNGKTYFMREEDRLANGLGYVGVIDPDAIVVVFKNKTGKATAAISFFTGHPVAAYNPENMISYGQFPQAASESLSSHLGNIPVAFMQGCGGDINSKHMLTGTIDQAKDLGVKLSETFIIASDSLISSKRKGFEWSKEIVNVPFANLPSKVSLQKDLETMDDFIARGESGDENTLHCVGMNFPKALTPAYRAKLIELVRPWYVWALKQHEDNNLNSLPRYMPIEIVVARFGDVGYVGLPYESFVKTGLKIKTETNLPIVLTSGYTNGSYGYIPDASAADDREYMSGFYRYKGNIPPYKAPAGDECAVVAVKKLNDFAR